MGFGSNLALNNELREKVWKVLAAQHYFVTAYHPCANGIVEVMIGSY